jgi:ERF superfamily
MNHAEHLRTMYPNIAASWPQKEPMMKVYQAINAVQRALSKDGISKNRTNSQGAGYKFRGIDDVYNAVSPLLAEHGLCILPRMLTRNCEERQSKAGSALFYVTVEAEFDFVAVEDGSKHTVKTFGEAMDSGDKATNKAMSAAYKYAAFQAFAIPTEGDNDADAHTPQVVAKSFRSSPTMGAMDMVDEDRQTYLQMLGSIVTNKVQTGAVADAYEKIKAEKFDSDETTALWSLLDSKVRSALKKHSDSLKTSTKETAAA